MCYVKLDNYFFAICANQLERETALRNAIQFAAAAVISLMTKGDNCNYRSRGLV